MRIQSIFFLLIILSLASCRGDEYIIQTETDVIAPPEQTAIKGFYVLNEGNMGSNKATLDFLITLKAPTSGTFMQKPIQL